MNVAPDKRYRARNKVTVTWNLSITKSYQNQFTWKLESFFCLKCISNYTNLILNLVFMKVDPNVYWNAVRPEDMWANECTFAVHQTNASSYVVKSTLHFIIHILLFYSLHLFQCSCLYLKMKHGLEFYLIKLYNSPPAQFFSSRRHVYTCLNIQNMICTGWGRDSCLCAVSSIKPTRFTHSTNQLSTIDTW